MIYVDVRTIWHGQVGIHSKFLNYANNQKKDLCITCQGKDMIIKWQDLKDRVYGRSEKKFKDRHGGKDYYLYYFKWEPDRVSPIENPDPVNLELF